MLFWKFFFGLFIADLIFTFAWLAYNGLVVMAMVAFLRIGRTAAPRRRKNRQSNGRCWLYYPRLS